jgi:5-methylcytosine-specific restriction enzyme A
MPTRPGRTCLIPRCPNVVIDAGASRCRIHERIYQAELDRGRPGARARGYNVKWERIRRHFLEAFPLCVMCRAPATDVDHIIAKRDGGSDDWGNLRSLCHSCHSSRTGRDQGHFSRRDR